MLDPKKIEEVVQGLIDALPSGLVAMQADAEKNMRAVLSSLFAKLDLVTRKEFDIQSQVLQRTREKLDSLEQQLAEIEKKRAGD